MYSQWPIFIMGCQRSGTSLLRRILDSHTNIACPPESSFLVQLARLYEIPRSREGLAAMGVSDEDILKQMRLFTETVFAQYLIRKNKNRWADKTPHYVNHIDTIDKMFNGNIKYLGIVRHGLDVAESLTQFSWGVLKPYYSDSGIDKRVAAAKYWRDQNLKILRAASNLGDRFMIVKYEELTSSPIQVLQEVFSFLDEPWQAEVLDYNSFKHDLGFEDPKIMEYDGIRINSMKYGGWPKEVIEEAYRETEKVMNYWGYSI